jgi:hypothetical protein
MARVFSVALHAAEAASLSLECVDAHMSNMPGLNGLREASTAGFTIVPLDFPVLNPTSALQSSSFEKLTVLRIFVGFKRDLVDEERLERFRLRLISFITQASSLHTLGLTFRPSLTLRKRICVKGFIKDLILSSSLRRMKVFELTGMTSILPALIEAFKPLRKTLRGVKMYHVLLLDGSWVEWIEWVRDMVINLEDLDIDHARETFPPPACHKGSGMKDCLNDTIKKWEGIRERFYKYDYNDNFYDHSEESNDHSEESNDHSEESNDHSEESNDHSEDSDDDF